MNSHSCFTAWVFSNAIRIFWVTLVLGCSALHAQNEALRLANVIIGDAVQPAFAVVNSSGLNRPLAKGMKLQQGTTIVTGLGGKVTLLFANGSVLHVKAESQVVVETCLVCNNSQGHSPAKLSLLEKEPGISRTRLVLREGDIIGDVKRLNHQEGSQFDIVGGVYSVGIRGTHWWMKLRVDGEKNVDWGFGIAKGSGVVIGGDNKQEYTLAERRVLLVKGKIDAANNLVAEPPKAEPMPQTQCDSICSFLEKCQSLFDEYPKDSFYQ